MTELISTSVLYDAFAVITQKGEKVGDAYIYRGITAQSFNDGYELLMKTSKASITLGFHNTQKHECESMDDFEQLADSLSKIAMESAT